jgi:hypothetical protein
MAGIDYTIPGQFKGIQLESPMNAMAQAMQLRGLQEASQLNALRAQEYELKTQDAREMSRQRNALAQYLANPKKPTNPLDLEAGVRGVAPLLADQWVESQLKRGELDEKIEGRKYQNFERKFKLYQSVTPNIRSIDDVSKFVAASYQDPDLGPILKQIRPYEDAINANQDAFNEDPDNWRLQAAGVSAKDIAEIARTKEQEKRLAGQEERAAAEAQQKERDRVAPKWELRKIGDREVLVNVNPYSETVGQIKPGAEALVDDTPKWTARDIGGKIVYVDENRFSKTVGTQKTDMELTKTAAPAVLTESPLARLVREREALEGEAPNSPLLKAYDEAISKETGGAPPDLIKEYLYAQKNNKFTGTLLDFKKQVAMAGRNVTNNPAAITPVTIVDPNNPDRAIVVNGRDGRVIGQAIKEPSGVQLSAKERQNREAKYPQATAAVKTYETKSEQLARDLETLANHPGLDGISGAIYGRLPSGTKDSMAAQEKYNAIVARGGFTELADMRASSPTGGALGNVSNQEGQYLRDAFASIGRTQSRDDLKAALIEAAKRVRESKGRIREAYDMTYEYRDGGQTTPAAPKSDIQNKADAVLRGAK